MKLKEFIKTFVEPNTMIRLLFKNKSGHEIVGQDWNDVCMEWELLRGKGNFRHYINNNVIGVTDILVKGPYAEAINIVIEQKD